MREIMLDGCCPVNLQVLAAVQTGMAYAPWSHRVIELANLHRIELHIEFRRIPLTKRRFSAERILRAGVPTPSSFGTETQISCARAWKQFNKPLPCSLGALPHKR